MNQTDSSRFITLDWDNISLAEAQKRCQWILDNYSDISKLMLSLSPTKGFHVRLHFDYPHLIARVRRSLKDDGNRLLHDLLNRPDYVHDILWNRKVINGVYWYSEQIQTWNPQSN